MTDFSRAYHYDLNKFYDGEIACQIDPLASKTAGHLVFLLPAFSTYCEPLPEKAGYHIRWNGESWEYWTEPEPEPYIPTPEEQKQAEIDRLKDELASTDYKIIKCSEYSLNGQELPYDIAELHANRQAIRDRINELENE